jgi:transglutaminase-like putative cysteine protease
MRVKVTHTTRLEYDGDVVEGVMDLHLGPFDDAHQRCDRFNLRVSPTAAIRQYRDGLGNVAHLVTLTRAHSYVEVIAQSEVVTTLSDPFYMPDEAPPPLSALESADGLGPSPLVPLSGGELDSLVAELPRGEGESDLDFVGRLNHWVYENLSYQPAVTDVSTTAVDVLAGREGVCQDFSHLLLALCRRNGIPSRYVSGYIVPSQARLDRLEQQPQWRGLTNADGQTGASHAWVESFISTHGWRGFDPTNNVMANENHVKIAIGRDYRDVAPTRGTYRGPAEESLSVDVVARAIR